MPAEIFNPDVVRAGTFGNAYEVTEGEGLSFAAYLAWAQRTYVTENGVFGAKVLIEDFDHLRGFPAFWSLLDESTIIYLNRRDKSQQAVSYYFAEMTGQWIAGDPPRMRPEEVPYNFARLNDLRDMLLWHDNQWRGLLLTMRKAFVDLTYEDFLADVPGCLMRLAEAVGVDTDNLDIVTEMKRQDNAFSRAMLERFERDLRERYRALRDCEDYNGFVYLP